jgi:hypothetical protein
MPTMRSSRVDSGGGRNRVLIGVACLLLVAAGGIVAYTMGRPSADEQYVQQLTEQRSQQPQAEAAPGGEMNAALPDEPRAQRDEREEERGLEDQPAEQEEQQKKPRPKGMLLAPQPPS